MEMRIIALLMLMILSVMRHAEANIQYTASVNGTESVVESAPKSIEVNRTVLNGSIVRGAAATNSPAPMNDSGKCQIVMSTNHNICGMNLACITVTRDGALLKSYPHDLWTTEVKQYWKSHTQAKIKALQFTQEKIKSGDCNTVRVEPYIGFDSIKDHKVLEFKAADRSMVKKLDQAVGILKKKL
jgi:hypothetical protein